ncbi:hypothetical protein GCM10027269_43970 [Kribbella endophytica]
MPRRIDHHTANRVAGHRRTAPAQRYRRASSRDQSNRRSQISLIRRNHDKVRDRPVVRAVGSVKRTTPSVVTNSPAQLAPQLPNKPANVVRRATAAHTEPSLTLERPH